MASNNGRCCEHHPVCGQEVVEGMLLRFRWVPVEVDGRNEMGIAAHIALETGQDGCRVGFLKRHMKPKHKQLEGVTARVICVLTTDSTSTPMACDRAFTHHNKGSCKVVCTAKWNEVEGGENKRPIDSGVLLMPRKRKNKNKIVIGQLPSVNNN
jgi:hypothetical protein